MQGTIINSVAVIAGSLIGVAIGKALSANFKKTLTNALGLATIVIGLQMALKFGNLLPVVAALLLGAITGELLKLEEGINLLGNKLKLTVKSRLPTFVEGFVTASILYLMGAMSILGAIEEGTGNPPTILYIKSMLDFCASIALASTLGIGVAFAAISVFLFQGVVTIAAGYLTFLNIPEVIEAISATGGVLILAIGITLLEIARIRIASLLPSIVYIVIWVTWLS
ncbi:MAG: DUF554 domain-containing protein [Deltaproteobacteria bacterium]|nr:DUF554 domain-containing protein [Deltaproteobacteria bacterium]